MISKECFRLLLILKSVQPVRRAIPIADRIGGRARGRGPESGVIVRELYFIDNAERGRHGQLDLEWVKTLKKRFQKAFDVRRE